MGVWAPKHERENTCEHTNEQTFTSWLPTRPNTAKCANTFIFSAIISDVECKQPKGSLLGFPFEDGGFSLDQEKDMKDPEHYYKMNLKH